MADPPQDLPPDTHVGGFNAEALYVLGLGGQRTPASEGARSWVPPTVEELQRLLPQYEIIELVGRGGMGAVYKGTQRSLDRFVAIKILPPGIEDEHDVHYAERFKMEAKAMARFDHPGIVAVHDAGETADGLLYFVMDYIEGTDVQRMIAQGPLPPERALAITAHVCDALGFAHESGIVHRDIKPANIMVDRHGRVKVADFGLAKVTTQESGGFTRPSLAMGTPDFMAPEVMTAGATVDGRADLYAVGVMLYAMLTGEIPRGRFALPSTQIAGLDPRFDAIVDKAMQADREHRYASAAALRTDLDRLLTAPTPVDAPLPRRSKMPWLAVAAAIIALLSGGGWWLAQWKKSGVSAPKPAVADSPQSRIAALAANPANWVDRLNSRKWEGFWVLKNGVLKNTGKTRAGAQSLTTVQDGAIRVRARSSSDTGVQLQLALRGGPVPGMANTTRVYNFSTNLPGTTCSLIYLEKKFGVQATDPLWRDAPLPAALAGQKELEWELRAVGDELSAWANGQPVASAHDARALKGSASFASDVGLEITKVETIDFASGSASTPLATLATATKDAPFVNTLGMKFVPVPITGGPTDGQRVLFSVWETRVQDYEVFAKETKREWPKPGFAQGPTHPAVNVRRDDAQAFCAWLTERERKAGRLAATERYRLPSDHEWSCAIGIGDRENPERTPSEKSQRITDVFPWGSTWPPPSGVANLSSEEAAGHEKPKGRKILTGYHDGFIETAPVGSFAANRLGLFDLGGNVREWCEDWSDRDQQRRLVRGAAFNSASRGPLLSSDRLSVTPGMRDIYCGFRVVLAADKAP